MTKFRRVLSTALATVAALAMTAGAASANNLFSLDSDPTSPGKVVQDASGNAYVAWVHAGHADPDAARFCKIPRGGTCTSPIALPIPGATSVVDGVAGAFPILGPGSTVYVIAPRYVQDDVIKYTSTNGGLSFDGGVAINAGHNTPAGAYSNKTNPTDVILVGSQFVVGAYNAGLGFSAFGLGQGNFTFASPGPGGVASSSMALDASNNPVIAYFNLNGTQNPILFYRYNGSMALTLETNWTGPTAIANGQEPRLSGGASGLFLAANEYADPAATTPTVLTVRKYTGTVFGAAVPIFNDPSASIFVGGVIGQSPAGRVVVAWPTSRGGDGARVLRLYTSTNGGASYGATADIARVASGYGIEDNAQIAAGDDGQGWVTFRDSGGLEVADFSPITPFTPPPPTPTPTPPAYTGANKTVTKGLGGGALSGVSLTLKVPKSCLQARQAFKVFVGTKVKHSVAKGKHVAVTKVVFGLDGIALSTRKHGPFTLVVATLGGTTHSVHTVTAKVTVRVRRKHHKDVKVTKTIKGTITIC